MHRCTLGVCVHAKKWKTEPEHHLLSLQFFFVSWQRERKSKVRKCQEMPAHLATGQCKVYGPLLTLQSTCLLLPVLPGMAVSAPERKPGSCCNTKLWVSNSHASLLARGALRD